VTSAAQEIALVGSVKPDTSWQAHAEAGFAAHNFQLDWDQKVATCPQGQTSVRWRERTTGVWVAFDDQICADCSVRAQCTRSRTTGRILHLRPHAQHVALEARRAEQTTPAFRERYQRRAGVEGTISQGVRCCGLRRSRYIGQAKTHLQHVLGAAALNLVRLMAWQQESPLAPPTPRRPPPFSALAGT